MDEQTLQKLREIRTRKNISIKPSPYLRTEIRALDGSVRPFKLRDYQIQMVLHLLTVPRFVVGDDTGLGKCVTRDTLIETDQGLVPIGSLQPVPDMKPDTFEPVRGWRARIGTTLVPIKSFYNSGKKPTRRVRTQHGFEVEGSLVHPLLARSASSSMREWRQVQEIKRGDVLCVSRGGYFPDAEPSLVLPADTEDEYPVPDKMNPDLARLLGYIVGGVGRHLDWEARQDIASLLLSQLGWEGSRNDIARSPFLRSYLESMGVDYTGSADRTVPPAILGATRASVREFLRGFFEVSGVGMGGIGASTDSEELGRQVQLLLLRFGIVASRSRADETFWRLQVLGEDTRKFIDEIGFVSTWRLEHLAGMPAMDNPDQDYFYDPVVEITPGFKEVVDIEVDDPRHRFVGNGFVNHNTAESISALCYVWMRNPDEKAIVLTKKSAISQWAKEFDKFTQGVRVIVVRGTPKKRQKLYQEFQESTGPTVMISGYRTIVNDFGTIHDWSGYTLVADECFQYHTPVTLADGSTELIGKIVSKRLPVEVLSWNPKTGTIEPKRVTAWHRNPLHKGSRKDLLHIGFRFGGNVRVTRTHKFYAPDGKEIRASRLRKNSEVLHLCHNVPSEDQWQVILGGLLGDSCVSFPNRPKWGVNFGHSTKQRDYLCFKRQVLSALGVSNINEAPNGGYSRKDGADKGYARFRLKANKAVTSFLVQARVIQKGRKKVTFRWLDRVTPLGLAVWYADDGSLQTHTLKDGTPTYRINLHTQGYTKDEVEFLAGWLRWKWGVDAEVRVTKPRSDRPVGQRKSYPYIHLRREAAEKFLSLLPGGFPGVMYKFPGKQEISLDSLDTSPRKGLVVDWVTKRQVWVPPTKDKDRYVYNLEVEGNHNYFANGTLVSNCTVFKNPSTQVHRVLRHLSGQAKRVWGLTATLIKNNLVEGFGIYQVVVPGLFRHTKTGFMRDYCIVRMVRVKGNRQVPQIVGYRDSDIQRFKEKIEPYYLGRPKHAVADELPVLQTKDVYVGLTRFQHEKYQEALSGLLELGTGEEKETDRLTAIIYCQEIVDHPHLLGYENERSEKLDVLVDLLTEGGDLEGEKVIVFTRFKKMVDCAIPVLEKAGVKCVRVTGSEDDLQRKTAMESFQDINSETKVIWITMAGGDAINLQAAKAIVFYDSPWSAGDYLQILGRMIRIGSLHDRVYALHLIAEDTVDERVKKVRDKKMNLIQRILGERVRGEKLPGTFTSDGGTRELFDFLVADAHKLRKKGRG